MSHAEQVSHEVPGRISYRAYPNPASEDGTRMWQVLYRQDPRVDYWGPRAIFMEQAGRFTVDGRDFSSAAMALSYVAAR